MLWAAALLAVPVHRHLSLEMSLCHHKCHGRLEDHPCSKPSAAAADLRSRRDEALSGLDGDELCRLVIPRRRPAVNL